MFLFKKIAYLFILALNFVINYAIVCTLVSFVLDIVRPELPWLQELILRLGLPYTVQTRILVLGFLVVVIPCLFSHTGIMERYCCWTLGGRRPAPQVRAYLDQLMDAVCRMAGKRRKDYRLYVLKMDQLNAMSIGRHSILVTLPLLQLGPEQVAGIIAHEMGHLEHGDTSQSLVLTTLSILGHTVLNIYGFVLSALQYLSLLIPFVGPILNRLFFFLNGINYLILIILDGPLHLINLMGNRQQEYDADRYACEIGLGRGLYNGLAVITQSEGRLSWWQRIHSDHPDTQERLRRIAAYVNKEKEIR
ncbi:MAG: M48 family metalloprotease [Succiniclasticum sp.]|nr:M48 family metalloprotease [Succiniclasticum sp.]MEE3478854.1 M48 family metalloprotease [Succiniclasticum sp.]